MVKFRVEGDPLEALVSLKIGYQGDLILTINDEWVLSISDKGDIHRYHLNEKIAKLFRLSEGSRLKDDTTEEKN